MEAVMQAVAEYTADKRNARRRIRMRNGFHLIDARPWRDTHVWQEMEAIAMNGCSEQLFHEITWLKQRFIARGQQIVRFNWVFRYFPAENKTSQAERLAELENISEQIWHSDNMIAGAIGHCRTVMDIEAAYAAAHVDRDERTAKEYDLLLGNERDLQDEKMREVANI